MRCEPLASDRLTVAEMSCAWNGDDVTLESED